MTMYDVAINMAKQERGLVAFAKRNHVAFDAEACNSDRTLGLFFTSVNDGIEADAALLNQATKRIVEHVRLCR